MVSFFPDLVKKSSAGRIVNLASTASQFHRINDGNVIVDNRTKRTLNEGVIYSLSKLYTVYMTWEMSSRLKEYGINVNCVHPGIVATDIFQRSTYWSTITGKLFICFLRFYMKVSATSSK